MPLSPTGKLDRDALPEPPEPAAAGRPAGAPPEDELEAFLADLWCRLLDVERVGRDDRFFELGASSLHAARFVNELQDELGAFVYVVTVFDAPTVAEYARFLRRDYPDAVEDRFGSAATAGPDGNAATAETGTTVETAASATPPDTAGPAGPTPEARDPRPVDEDDLARFREAVPRFPLEDPPAVVERNEPAIFILAPPRSGTTLLRVMLAGHPDLFAAAELQLLHFERLRQRRRAFRGRFEVWLEGTVRAVMELDGKSPEEARAWMARQEDEDFPVRDLYRRIQERLDGGMLVEKTPSYALDPHALRRAERDFRKPRYVHLSRHPYAVVESFVSQHMEQVLFLRDHPFGPRALGELVWTASHRTVEAFLSDVPAARRTRLRFEDLVRRPDDEMRALCRHLDLPFHPALLRPYEDLDRKMVDGVHDDSTPMGDQKLLERSGIDPSVADAWRGVLDDDYLGEPTWETAERLGYERPETATSKDATSEGAASKGATEAPPTGGAGSDASRRGARRRRRLRARRERARRGDGPTGPDPDRGET